MATSSRRLEAGALTLIVALYGVLVLPDLGTLPPVYEDEPWQASTAWKLAREGVFGSDLFAGLDFMERSCFRYPPVHPLLLAATFRLVGPGLVAARSESVALGFLALLATWALGRQLAGPAVGALGALLLLLVRTSYVDRYQGTGLLFVDTVRLARYDAVVPFFALLAALVATRAAARRRSALWAIAGALVGVASLTHLYGLFLGVPLALLALWERAGWRALAALAAGLLVPWTAYAVYVAGDLDAWRAQTRWYGERFRLTDLSWYLDNLARERLRYAQGLGPPGVAWLARPGLWTAALGLPFALVTRLSLARAGDAASTEPGAAVPRRLAARALVLSVATLPALYASLLWLKLPAYRATLLPFTSLLLAWGLVALWRAEKGAPPRRRVVRIALVALALAIGAEATGQIAARAHAASATTPWATFTARLRAALPDQGRVLLLHTYAFGLEARDVRSWLVPLALAEAGGERFSAERLARELDALAPAAVVVDDRVRDLFSRRPEVARAVDDWLRGRGYLAASTLFDATYGTFALHRAPAETP